jgi:hypothetical protein
MTELGKGAEPWCSREEERQKVLGDRIPRQDDEKPKQVERDWSEGGRPEGCEGGSHEKFHHAGHETSAADSADNFCVRDVSETGVVESFCQQRAYGRHDSHGEGRVELTEINEGRLVRHRGDQELERYAVEEEHPKVLAGADALRSQPDEQKCDNEGQLKNECRSPVPAGLGGVVRAWCGEAVSSAPTIGSGRPGLPHQWVRNWLRLSHTRFFTGFSELARIPV